MNNIKHILGCYISLLVIMSSMHAVQAAPDDFGRLFTTPDERSALQELRNAEPINEEPVKIIIPEVDDLAEKKPVPRNLEGITLNGLVVRKDGKSTVWLNGSNSYEGSLASEYFHIDTDDINNKKVLVKVPDVDLEIDLKVGQTYEPEDESLLDIVDDGDEVRTSKN